MHVEHRVVGALRRPGARRDTPHISVLAPPFVLQPLQEIQRWFHCRTWSPQNEFCAGWATNPCPNEAKLKLLRTSPRRRAKAQSACSVQICARDLRGTKAHLQPKVGGPGRHRHRLIARQEGALQQRGDAELLRLLLLLLLLLGVLVVVLLRCAKLLSSSTRGECSSASLMGIHLSVPLARTNAELVPQHNQFSKQWARCATAAGTARRHAIPKALGRRPSA